MLGMAYFVEGVVMCLPSSRVDRIPADYEGLEEPHNFNGDSGSRRIGLQSLLEK